MDTKAKKKRAKSFYPKWKIFLVGNLCIKVIYPFLLLLINIISEYEDQILNHDWPKAEANLLGVSGLGTAKHRKDVIK